MFEHEDVIAAAALLERMRARKLMMVTAESCTGGLIAALLTEIPGSSDVIERGFVTYSNAAKCDLLGVPATLIGRYGAVSAEVAVSMAAGALRASTADLAISVTGVAGPGGGTAAKPVGLVFLAAQLRGQPARLERLELGNVGRSAIRLASIRAGLRLADQALAGEGPARGTGG